MASTYENDLRLEEMATGENSGSWGTKTNTNLELIADAFSYGTETIADADTTLTIADGAADAARSLALKINSSEDLTTTRTVTLAPNTVSKVWIIENNTSGGQTLTISAGSGSNVTLPNGVTKIIATDGIGAAANVTELYTNLHNITIDGILSLADGTNSAPSLTNTGDTNTGLYFPATDEVGITTGGTQRVKIDSTGVDITGTLTSDELNVLAGNGVIGTAQINRDNDGSGDVSGVALSLANDGTSAGTGVSLRLSPADVQTALRGSLVSSTLEGSNGSNLEFWTAVTGFAQDKRLQIDGNGDITFYESDGTTASFVYDANAGTVFNEAGNDRDFRVESDSNANALFVNAGSDRIIFGGTDTINGADVEFLLGSGASESPYVSIRNNATNTLTTSASARLDIGTWTDNGAYPNASNSYTGKLLFLAQGTDDAYAAGGIESYLKTAGNRTRANTDSQLRFSVKDQTSTSAVEYFRLSGDEKSVVFNQTGADQDFRVESDSDTNMLYVDAENNRVSVGGGGPQARLNVFQNLNNSSDWWTNTRGALYLQNLNSSGHTVVKFNNETNTNASIVFNSTSSSGFQLFDRTSVEERLGVDSNELVINEGSQNFDFRVESDSNANMLFVDAGNDQVVVGDNGNYFSKFTVVGGKTRSTGIPLNQLSVYDNSAMASSTGGAITLWGNYTTNGAQAEGASIEAYKSNGTSGNYQYGMWLKTRTHGGSMDDRLFMDQAQTVFNETGANTDFRVESDSNANMLFVDAGDSHVNIGSSTAHGVLGVQQGASAGVNATTLGLNHVHASNKYIDFKWYNSSIMNIAQEGGSNIGINWSNTLAFNSSEVNSDFRIASDSISHLFAIDASENRVSIGGTNFNEGSGYIFNVRGGTSRFANPAADVTIRIEGGAYTNPHRARLTLTGGYGDTGRTRFWHIDGQAHGGGGNVYNDLRFSYEVTNSATLYEVLRFNKDGQVIVNEDGRGNVDFRVESDNATHALFVEADSAYVKFGKSADTTGEKVLGVMIGCQSSSANGRIGSTSESPSWFSKYGVNGDLIKFHKTDGTNLYNVGSISVTTIATAYNTSSDHRLKENVVDLTGATARLNQLAPKRFNFIADDTTTVDGFIAHEVQSIVPEAITGTHNEVDDDGNPVYQGIDQSKLVPLLVATIKELEARITALENA